MGAAGGGGGGGVNVFASCAPPLKIRNHFFFYLGSVFVNLVGGPFIYVVTFLLFFLLIVFSPCGGHFCAYWRHFLGLPPSTKISAGTQAFNNNNNNNNMYLKSKIQRIKIQVLWTFMGN